MTATAILAEHELYGGKDPRNRPLYSFPEAGRATGIPASTLRAWFAGTTYGLRGDTTRFEPVIRRPDPHDARVSFTNLIEAHVLRALRTVHDVRMSSVREAVDLAQSELGIDRLLISPDLRTSAGKLLLDRYTDLLELTCSQQIAIRSVLAQYLERVEYDESQLPSQFYPFERSPRNRDQKVILLSPFVSFGRPVLTRRGISTRAITQRLDAGEPEDVLLEDYGITPDELEEAVLFEAAA